MNVYRSQLIINKPDLKIYSFLSQGSKGTIKKIVELGQFPGTNIFNVLLVDEINGTRADDTDLTGNNDAIKVINTVARVIEKFLKKFPHSIVRISGNTAPKQLLYQRKIYQVDKTKYMILGNSREGGSFKEIERPVNKTGKPDLVCKNLTDLAGQITNLYPLLSDGLEL